MADWKFVGRSAELGQISAIINRKRWFFVNMTGRRRIGKTTLIQSALKNVLNRQVFYVQIPDSGDAGVLSAVNDAMETFAVPEDQYPRPRTLNDFARLIECLARAGYVIVLDEFQYFHRKSLIEFCSFLQAVVDRLAADAARVPGGLIVLGSVHAEMTALLEDQSAPLYNRTTDSIELTHLDLASVIEIIQEHAEVTPERFLFLWTLFEGVPKFYRDCFEQGVLSADRQSLILRMFFESSSPLRSEADNWFLRELRGRYDTVLKFVAKHPGRMHGELVNAIRDASGNGKNQVGGYLKLLAEKFRLIERKLPIFAKRDERRGRYYLSDNFLQAWLGALAMSVAAREFRPTAELVESADDRLATVEGFAFERMVGKLYEERSRKGLAGFSLTERIAGYWDKAQTEIDLVAINETENVIRFGSCKRSTAKLVSDVNNFRGHVDRFLESFPHYRAWKIEYVGFSPRLDGEARRLLEHHEVIPEDLTDLTRGLV